MSLVTAPAAPDRAAPATRPRLVVRPPVDALRRLSPVLVAALSVLAVGLWAPGIGTWYWIDEALSVGITRHDLLDIPGLLARDGSPPLWYLAMHVWGAAVGTSPTATHALSLVFAVACVPVAWWAGRVLAGRRAGLFVAAITSMSPFLDHFSRETRMYSLVTLLTLVVVATFVRAFVDGSRLATAGFVVALTALVYTHNWGLYTTVGAALAVGVVVVTSDDRRAVLCRAVVAFAVVGVAYLPWVPTLLDQLRSTGAPWSFTPSIRDVARELAALFRDERILIALVVPVGAGVLPVLRRWRSRDATVLAVLAVFAAIPVGIGWVAAHVEPSWATRYLAVVVAPLVLLVGIGLARAGGVGLGGMALVALLLLQPVTRLGDGVPRPHDAKSNAAAIAAYFRPQLRPGDVVVVAQPEAVPLFAWYLGDDLRYADPNGPVADTSLMDWRDAEARLATATVDSGLRPLLDGMAAARRILLVSMRGKAAPTDTSWISMIRTDGRLWEQAVRDDPRFRLVDARRTKRPTAVPFKAVLFERVP